MIMGYSPEVSLKLIVRLTGVGSTPEPGDFERRRLADRARAIDPEPGALVTDLRGCPPRSGILVQPIDLAPNGRFFPKAQFLGELLK
jgi:hypothetical protein